MSLIRSAALAALLVISTSSIALAHKGVIHTGCPYGQVFTAGGITVSGAYIRATVKGAQVAGAYLSVANSGTEADSLTGASSEAASSITLHQMHMNGNVMEMTAVEGGLEVPPGGSVALDPMGYHLMMTGMEQQFVEGACVAMVLHFAKAGDIPVQLNIGKINQDGAPTGAPEGASSQPDMSGMDMSSMAM